MAIGDNAGERCLTAIPPVRLPTELIKASRQQRGGAQQSTLAPGGISIEIQGKRRVQHVDPHTVERAETISAGAVVEAEVVVRQALPVDRSVHPSGHRTDELLGPRRDVNKSETLHPHQPLVAAARRSEEHTSELQSRGHLVCRLLLETKKMIILR